MLTPLKLLRILYSYVMLTLAGRGIRSFERLEIREVQYTKKSNCYMLSSPSDHAGLNDASTH